LAEHRIRNAGVVGSTPTGGSLILFNLNIWRDEPQLSTGTNSTLTATFRLAILLILPFDLNSLVNSWK